MTLEYPFNNQNSDSSKDIEETKLEKMQNILEDAFYSKLGMAIIRFVLSWMFFGMLGIAVLVAPLYVLDNYVPSIPIDIKENEYYILNVIGSYIFTILHVSIVSASNSWIVKNLSQIPKLNKRMEKVESTLKVDQTMKKAYDLENLLMYAKILNATIKRDDPEAYEIMMDEIKNSKTEHELSIKKVGIDFYDDNKKIKNDIQKIKEKLGMSRYYTNPDEDSL